MFNNYQEFPSEAGIYKITTKHNGLFYIGSAVSLSKRMKDHRNDLKRGNCHVSRMQRIFNKYGEDDFQVEFLEVYDKRYHLNSDDYKRLLRSEEEFISKLKPKYNTIKTPTSQLNNPATSRRVFQYSMDGTFIEEWKSGREVTRQLGIQPLNGLKGPNRSSGGFRWSYRKVAKLKPFKSGSGVKKSICMTWGRKLKTFESLTECVEYFSGDRKTYQRIAYAIKVGKLYDGKSIVYCDIVKAS